MEGKKRLPRTTKKQIEIIIDFLEENTILMKTNLSSNAAELAAKKWNELSDRLNEGEIGPKKTVIQWKSVVAELKTNVKKKARALHNYEVGTGGGPAPKGLTPIEEKLYHLICPTVVEGAKGTKEIGISEDNNGKEENIEIITEENINVEFHDLLPLENVEIETEIFPPLKTKKRTMLEEGIEQQKEASAELANAIKILAEGINNLAGAINNLKL